MLVDRSESKVCAKSPGLDEDLKVTADTATLTDAHRGRVSFSSAVASSRMRIDGPPALARAFPTWGGLSDYVGVRHARFA